MLAAVAFRAFEDINPKGNRAGVNKGDNPTPEAMRWIRGELPIRHWQDEFMSFEHICAVLRWPHAHLLAYAESLVIGEGDEFIRQHPNLTLLDSGRVQREGGVGTVDGIGAEGGFRLSFVLSSED